MIPYLNRQVSSFEHTYAPDTRAAQAKVHEAGLSELLADRLEFGN